MIFSLILALVLIIVIIKRKAIKDLWYKLRSNEPPQEGL